MSGTDKTFTGPGVGMTTTEPTGTVKPYRR